MLFLSTSSPPKISNSRGTKFCSFIQRPPPYNVCSLIRCTLLRGLGLDLNIHHISLRTGIEDPPVIVKILSHLGLPTRAPPRAPARRVDLFQTIGEAQTAERPKPMETLALSASKRKNPQDFSRVVYKMMLESRARARL